VARPAVLSRTTTVRAPPAVTPPWRPSIPSPGDEIITTPITDMGAITPILYQTAIPSSPTSTRSRYNLTAGDDREEDHAPQEGGSSSRTSRQTPGHGSDPDLCRTKKLPVIEDAAQAFGATYKASWSARWRHRLLQPAAGRSR